MNRTELNRQYVVNGEIIIAGEVELKNVSNTPTAYVPVFIEGKDGGVIAQFHKEQIKKIIEEIDNHNNCGLGIRKIIDGYLEGDKFKKLYITEIK